MKKLLLLTILLLLLGIGRAEASFSLSIVEPDGHFFSGDKVERTITMPEILPKFTEATLRWETSVPPAIIQRGSAKRKWSPEPGENIFLVTLNMPEVKRRAELVWKIRMFLDGRESLQQEIHYSILPRDIPRHIKTILSRRTVGIVDSKGEMGKIFQPLDVPFTALNSQLSLETFPGDLIIIGPRALPPRQIQSTLLSLKEKVKKGLTVLCFKSGNLPQFPIPLQNITARPMPISSSKISAPGHPIFQGIKERDLSRWQGDGTIGSDPYQLPQGNFKALSRTDDLPGYAASPLIEVLYGQGKYIFSQLSVIEKFKQEPVARLLFENLIRYALMKQEPLRPAAIYGDPESEMMKVLDSLKVAGLRHPDQLDDFHFVIICANQELAQLKERGFQERLKQFVRQGGTLIVFDFTRENLNFFEEIIPDLEWVSPIDEPISLDRENSLLWGITKEDVKQIFNVENFLYLKESERVKMLIKPGALVKIEYDKGQIILCQIQFKEEEETSLRLLSQLLTNLGVEIKAEKEVN